MNDKISKEYSQAIKVDSSTVVSKTKNAKFAEYSKDDLAALPEGIEEKKNPDRHYL